MVGRGWPVALLAVALAGPLTGAAAPLTLTAELAFPVGAAGVVGPTQEIPSFWMDGTLPQASTFAAPILAAAKARMVIETHAVDAPFTPATRALPDQVPRPDPASGTETFDVVDATLEVLSADATAQYRALEWNWKTKGLAAVETSGARCEFREPVPGTVDAFPDDPRGVPVTYGQIVTPNTRNIEARCSAHAATVTNPSMALLYGLELRLRSDAGERTIRTGQFDQPGPGGVTTQRVEQILRVQWNGADLAFDLAAPHDVQMFAPQFAVAGTIGAPTTHGSWTWGDQRGDGDLETFAAEGAFLVERGPAAHAQVSGQALRVSGAVDAPDDAGFMVPPLTLHAVVAVGLLALAVRLVGWLFSRVAPDRVLDHPRRAAILVAVRDRPGTTVQDVARAMSIHWTVAAYHLAALQRGGHVSLARVGGRTAVFPLRGLHAPVTRNAWLRRTNHGRVHALVVAVPGAGPTALAQQLGLTQPRVSQVLGDLVQAGLLERERRGRRVLYRARGSNDA